MDTTTLRQILIEEMEKYAGRGINAHSSLTYNDAEQTYAVIDFATVRGRKIVSTVLVGRIVDDQIIIDVDKNSKPLVDALQARGVPEDKIVLGYLQEQSNLHI